MERQTHAAVGTSPVAWIALIVAVLAMILAWNAFNRAGADLEAMVALQVDEATQELQQEFRQAENATREGTADSLEVGAAALSGSANALDAGASSTNEAAIDVRSE